MTLGTDLSNFQAQFSLADAQALRAAGIEFVFVGQHDATVAAEQYAKLRAAGMPEIHAYLESQHAWPVLADDQRVCAIAVETGSGFETEEDIDNALLWVRSVGRTPVMYSSAYMWSLLGLDGVTKYADQGIASWVAAYDGQVNLHCTPFGGMTPRFKQYSEHGRVPGIAYDLDLNYCEDAPIAPAQPTDWNAVIAAQPAQEDEDSMADRVVVKGSQNIAILNAVSAAALGPLVAENETHGVRAYVRRGPSVDLGDDVEEYIIRVPKGTIPALQ